ncbi:hypothetical protein GCM10020000_33830 [Streptomyces olivoverticillatus]
MPTDNMSSDDMSSDDLPTHGESTHDSKHGATAAALLPLLGGAGNVLTVAHCMTRLRLELRDRALVRDEALRALPAVLGVVEDGGAYQIVLGPGTVARVAPELQRLVTAGGGSGGAPPLAERGAALRAARKARNATPGKLLLGRIARVFVPLIPALIGCGIVAGLAGLLANAHWLPALAPALTAIASGFMSLISVFVGYQTAKEFGGTPVLGGAVAAVIVYGGRREGARLRREAGARRGRGAGRAGRGAAGGAGGEVVPPPGARGPGRARHPDGDGPGGRAGDALRADVRGSAGPPRRSAKPPTGC